MCCAFAATHALLSQTADPSATPAGSSSAPSAKAGTYSVTEGEVLAAPGLLVPNGNLPWALDVTPDGKAALVPVHHSTIPEPTSSAVEAPVSRSLGGAHARTLLRSPSPVFFVHGSDRTENTGDAGRGNPTGWVLVAAQAEGGNRSIPRVNFAEIQMGTACVSSTICLHAETLPDGWVRLALKGPIAAGEYALLPVQRSAKAGVLVVYDFAIDAGAPLAKDAVVAGAPPAANRHKH